MNNTPSKWQHPIHSRGVPSRRYDTAVGAQLTDAKIHEYCLKGFYGEEERLKAQEVEDAKKRHREIARTTACDLIKKTGAILDELYSDLD